MPAKKQQSGKEQQSSSTKGSERIVDNAQKIVSSAIHVLEEEIAAGILAAKKLENKLIDVEEVHGNQDELMNRICRDTHEAVDLFLDAFSALTQQLNSYVDKSKTKESKSKSASVKQKYTPSKSTSNVFLEAAKIAKPGEVIHFQLLISDDEQLTQLSLQKSAFTSNSIHRIELRNISVKPATIQIKPKDKAEITITVKIPKTAASGIYHATFTDKYNPKVLIILSLEIAA